MQVGNKIFNHLTLCLDMSDRLAVLVGGGSVAVRKVQVLKDAGMVLEVIAPDVAPVLASLAEDGALVWHQRTWCSGDLKGAALVVAATSSREINHQVALEAKSLGIPVNVADRGEEGDCLFPAMLRRGRLEIAVSTGGASPAVAVAIRDNLAETIGEEYEKMLNLLADLREKLLTLGIPEAYNATLVKALMEQGVARLLRSDENADAHKIIDNLLAAKVKSLCTADRE